MSITSRIDQAFYPHYLDNWDDALFRTRILERLRPEDRVLDLGAGAGIVTQMDFRGKAREICGVDMDPRVVDNPFLDDARIGSGEQIPYESNSFDLVFADNVAEHLVDPERVFAEVSRVLRPGGLFMFKTPNRNHYMPMIARFTPTGFHRFVNRRRGRRSEDTFPTVYKANSRRQVSRLAAATGFSVDAIERIEGRPEYLRVNPLSYIVGVAYERLVNLHEALSGFRIVLIATLRKP